MKPVLTIITLCFLYSCSQDTAKEKSNEPDSKVATNVATTPEPTPTEEEEGDLMTTERIGPLKIGKTALEIQKEIGNPEQRTKFEISPVDGLNHQTWTYDKQGIELGMIKDDQGAIILNSYKIYVSCIYETSRGIHLGSLDTEVLENYKNYIASDDHEAEDDASIIAGSVYGGVIFEITAGVVTRIYVGAAAE
jgi:hypothetical protein